MSLLDGKQVKPEEINPAKHRFIGTWRPPAVPVRPRIRGVVCPCGQELNYLQGSGQILVDGSRAFVHWQAGCFDEPQYVTIAGEIPDA